ncbi:MAG: DUF4256 domain-containing protein [Anaerococcus vaginalis]|nr:DUF4256 domain-containing protein [Anaerococcus vaginalis]MDU0946065.1 DUF4256 domain-containing protein [Anaerococcus vaginalis]MDU1030045.1 DUF4256 domain-containing protein [Anaerococcus vaginalis]
MGIRLINEEEYYALKNIEDFDIKTSSWVSTPDDIRNLGGALFCGKNMVEHLPTIMGQIHIINQEGLEPA